MLDVRPCFDRTSFDGVVQALGGHPLQLWGWGEQKSRHAWGAQRFVVLDGDEPVGACQVLTRNTPVPGRPVLYSPRGPVWAEGRGDDVVRTLAEYLRKRGLGVVWTVEPDATELPAAELFTPGENILIPHTLIVDLTQSEDEIRANMRSKVRQSANKAMRSVQIRRVTERADLERVMEVYHETSARAGFALHADEYYYDIQETMREGCRVLVAYDGEEPVAFLWNVVSDRTAFELYGGITEHGQKLRANYGLKLSAILEAKELGCTRYDMNGLLNEGITEFKTGFAKDHVDDLAGTFDLPLSPLYRPYRWAMPMVRDGLRKVRGVLGR